jgi:hypothetical protein
MQIMVKMQAFLLGVNTTERCEQTMMKKVGIPDLTRTVVTDNIAEGCLCSCLLMY